MPAAYTYVYMLASLSAPGQRYVGCTENLDIRLADHNRGHVAHTAKFTPWQIETAVAFRDRNLARAFERYLKTGSGREFSRRHFWSPT